MLDWLTKGMFPKNEMTTTTTTSKTSTISTSLNAQLNNDNSVVSEVFSEIQPLQAHDNTMDAARLMQPILASLRQSAYHCEPKNFLRAAQEDSQFRSAMQAGTRAYREAGLPAAYVRVLDLARQASEFPEAISSNEDRALFYLKALEYFVQVSAAPVNIEKIAGGDWVGASAPSPLPTDSASQRIIHEAYLSAGEFFLRRSSDAGDESADKAVNLSRAKICLERLAGVSDYATQVQRHLKRLNSDVARLSDTASDDYQKLLKAVEDHPNPEPMLHHLVDRVSPFLHRFNAHDAKF